MWLLQVVNNIPTTTVRASHSSHFHKHTLPTCTIITPSLETPQSVLPCKHTLLWASVVKLVLICCCKLPSPHISFLSLLHLPSLISFLGEVQCHIWEVKSLLNVTIPTLPLVNFCHSLSPVHSPSLISFHGEVQCKIWQVKSLLNVTIPTYFLWLVFVTVGKSPPSHTHTHTHTLTCKHILPY